MHRPFLSACRELRDLNGGCKWNGKPGFFVSEDVPTQGKKPSSG